MTYDPTESLDNSQEDTDTDSNFDVKASEVKDAKIRKRIDDLLEKKRLKELLDDSDDW
ncbi:PA3496 family putative envelope integrity protein [Colwelliaceae bacterium 6441]